MTIDEAWAAGFYEGEGSVSRVTTKRPGKVYYYPRLRITQVNREPLERLRAIFGVGWISKKPQRTACQPCHEWVVQGAPAEEVFKSMCPMLSARRCSQFEAVMESCQHPLQLQPTQPAAEGWS